jgi:hypothetical protein
VSRPARGRPLFATDLDRTLIYSAAAAGLGAEAGEEDVAAADPLEGAVGVEVYDGRTISYVTAGFPALLRALAERCDVVPVTTRTRQQHARITLFDERGPEWAIVANGGHLLHHGEPDAAWEAAARQRIAHTVRADLDAVAAHVGEAAAPWIDHVRRADDFFAYTLVDRAAMPLGAAEELAGWLGERGWRLSVQGRKLYAVPAALSKGAAVRELADRLGSTTVLAAGDSLLDQELLDVADIAIRPAHGELATAGYPARVVTQASGIVAGEEILGVVAALLSRR